jgi:hypothetical protein
MIEHFELCRLSDDLVYLFTRAIRGDGLTGFRRSDQDLWIVYDQTLGWVALDPESGTVAGRPWNVLPADQQADAPPEGEWVSKKGTKSYVYELVHIR